MKKTIKVYKVASVKKGDPFNDTTPFILTFEHPVNVQYVASQLRDVSPEFKGISANELVALGPDDDIQFQQADGVRTYRFTDTIGLFFTRPFRIQYSTVSIHRNGEITVEESSYQAPDS